MTIFSSPSRPLIIENDQTSPVTPSDQIDLIQANISIPDVNVLEVHTIHIGQASCGALLTCPVA